MMIYPKKLLFHFELPEKLGLASAFSEQANTKCMLAHSVRGERKEMVRNGND